MNFKRVAALLLAGAMVMTAVPVYAKGDDVTLSVSIWDTNQEPGIKEILADFTEKTGIKTEISVVKWDEYWTMLEAGAQGGSSSGCILDALQRESEIHVQRYAS